MIDFGAPIGNAYDRMVGNLFRPFDLGKWFALGFSAWLASLLDASGGGAQYQHVSEDDFNESMQDAVSLGLTTWMLILVAVFFLLLVLTVVMAWLGSRGHFMLVDNVRQNTDRIAQPWKQFADAANGFFVAFAAPFILWYGVSVLVILAGLAWLWPFLEAGNFPGFVQFVPWIAVMGALALTWIPVGVYLFFLKELGIPIAIREGCGVIAANRRMWALMKARPADIIVYALVRIAIGFVCLLILFILMCLTCCCIAVIPYIGVVLTLPLYVYRVHFTLECLRQFGPEFDLYPTGSEGPALPGM